MSGEDNIKFMRRCLDLAAKAEGLTWPNPMVGSVIVNDGIIIGEGFHVKAGRPHAEVIAIKSVKEKKLLGSSVLYVNLEPCSHFGKTPPCTDLILSVGIPCVVVGTEDTSEQVSGRGIAKLQNAGCKVITGVLEEECRELNRRFFTFHEKGRPFIVLKWAQSADGFIDLIRTENYTIEPNWITGKPERVLVHKWRAEEQAILVGAGTIRSDNPRLNVREWKGNNPVRIILSGSGVLDKKLAINELVGSNIVFTRNGRAKIPGAVIVSLNDERPAALQISEYLFKLGIQSLMIEGGAQVLEHFISSGLWDEARIFTGSSDFRNGIRAPAIDGKLSAKTNFSQSTLTVLMNNNF